MHWEVKWVFMNVLRRVAQIGQPGEATPGSYHVVFMAGAETKTHGILGIVRHRKAGDLQITKTESGAGFKDLPIGAMTQSRLHRTRCLGVGKDADVGKFLKTLQCRGMIPVFVGEKNGVNTVQLVSDALEELPQFSGGKTGIDQHVSLGGLEQGAIARTTATKNAKTQRHAIQQGACWSGDNLISVELTLTLSLAAS